MPLVSMTAYAQSHNVSKQSAAEWKARGYLVMHEGMVDVEASDQRMQGAGKGRFRVKAHGGRRQAGVRGVPDRPGLRQAPASSPAAKAGPWEGWHPVGNPVGLADTVRAHIEGRDARDEAEAIDLIRYSEWEDASTAAGWDRWPSDAAPCIAAELGLDDVAAVQEVLHRHVRARLAALGRDAADLEDARLTPR